MTDQELIAKLNDKIGKLTEVCEGLLDENDMLSAKVKKYEALLEAISDERGLLGVLQKMAHDPKLPEDTRIKAAAAALPYEKPKLSATVTANVSFLASRLDRARPAKVIEHEPKPSA